MTFTSYLDENGQRTAFDNGPDSIRRRMADDYIRQSHLDFRAAGNQHAESEGITDTMVQKHVDLALQCRAEGCSKYSFIGNEEGLCRTCAEERKVLKAQPTRTLSPLTKYILVFFTAVIVMVVAGAFIRGVNGQ